MDTTLMRGATLRVHHTRRASAVVVAGEGNEARSPRHPGRCSLDRVRRREKWTLGGRGLGQTPLSFSPLLRGMRGGRGEGNIKAGLRPV